MRVRSWLVFFSWVSVIFCGALALLSFLLAGQAADGEIAATQAPFVDRLAVWGSPLFRALFLVGIIGVLLDRFIGFKRGFFSQLRRCFKAVPEILRRFLIVTAIFAAVVNLDFLINTNLHLLPFPEAWGEIYQEHVSRHVARIFFGVPLYVFNAVIVVLFGASFSFGRSRLPAWERERRSPDLETTLILDRQRLKLTPRKLKWLKKAERLLERGRSGRAARLFEKLGESYLYRAGKLYEKIHRHERATEVFARAGQYFLEQGNQKRAGDAFFHGGRLQQALDAYRKVISSGKKTLTGERLLEIVKRMGEALFRLERYQEAGELLMKHECFAQAGECFEKAGAKTLAAEAYAKAGDLEASTRAFEDGGRPDLAKLEQGKWLMARCEFREAAAAFEAAGEWKLVGEALLAMGDMKRAAHAYFRDGESYEKAAELYLEVGDHEMAMESYSRMGAFEKTAQLAAHLGFQDKQAVYYEKAGLFLQAAKSFLMIGETQRAVKCLKQIAMESREEALATAQVISVLAKQGRVKEALACGEAVLEGKRPDPYSALVFFAFAGLLEKLGRTAQAADLFIQVAKALPEEQKYVSKAARIAEQTGIPFDVPIPQATRDAVDQPPAAARDRSEDEAEKVDESSLSEHTLTLDDDMVFDLTHDGELQRYEMIQELGRGGMGIVYKARDRKLNRLVAFKMLHPEYNKDPKIVLFFKRETRAIASLNHPNIVTLYDVGYQKGCFYMVMEFVHGMNMERLRKKHPTYVKQNILGLLYETCFGLKYAHEKGIVHRDLKPSNLMVTKDGRVKIMDFGLAKKVSDVTQTQQIWGTPVFMAPEVLQGERASFLSDIYSLGATIYTLVTGVPPFSKQDTTEKFVGDGLPIPADRRDPKISKNLSETISKCLYLDPRQRYQDLNELLTVVKLLGHRKKGRSLRRAMP